MNKNSLPASVLKGVKGWRVCSAGTHRPWGASVPSAPRWAPAWRRARRTAARPGWSGRSSRRKSWRGRWRDGNREQTVLTREEAWPRLQWQEVEQKPALRFWWVIIVIFYFLLLFLEWYSFSFFLGRTDKTLVDSGPSWVLIKKMLDVGLSWVLSINTCLSICLLQWRVNKFSHQTKLMQLK